MIVGYARVSTLEQEAGLEAQVRDLTALGCEKLYREQVSSVAPRAQLNAVLDFVREGDTLVVTKLDRLARSVSHLGRIIEVLEAKRVALRIVNLGVDTSTPTGKLMLNVMAGVAQFEREMMLERQREGIAKAKGEGKYRGRKPTVQARAAEIEALAGQGLSMGAIAAQLGIGKGSVHRVLNPKASA
ncbi:DNA invertase Pin-like site-specific DNA recombinase [Methylobacterium sp. OAE515]|uniref:recombinase family protein n=1 Tax=Methylobacterium sp. OAE515 TaxID=2817895 RepID=UPI00178A0B14